MRAGSHFLTLRDTDNQAAEVCLRQVVSTLRSHAVCIISVLGSTIEIFCNKLVTGPGEQLHVSVSIPSGKRSSETIRVMSCDSEPTGRPS